MSTRSSADHNHHGRIRHKCSSPIVAERFLDFVSGVTKEQAQFAGKENVACKVVDITFDRASVLILLVHKPDLSALLMAEIARGLPPNQSGTIAFIDVVDVNLYWRTRRDTGRNPRTRPYWASWLRPAAVLPVEDYRDKFSIPRAGLPG